MMKAKNNEPRRSSRDYNYLLFITQAKVPKGGRIALKYNLSNLFCAD